MLLQIMKGSPKQPRRKTKGVFLLYNGTEPEATGTAPSTSAGQIPAAGGGGEDPVPPRPAGPALPVGWPHLRRPQPRAAPLAALGSRRKAFGILAAALRRLINPNRKAWGEANSFHLGAGSLRARRQQREPPASLAAHPHPRREALLREQTPGERGYRTVSTRAGGGTKPPAPQQRPARARRQNSSRRAKPRRLPAALLPRRSPTEVWRVLGSCWGAAPHPDGCIEGAAGPQGWLRHGHPKNSAPQEGRSGSPHLLPDASGHARALTLKQQCLFPALLRGAAHLSAPPRDRRRKPRAAPGKEVQSPV